MCLRANTGTSTPERPQSSQSWASVVFFLLACSEVLQKGCKEVSLELGAKLRPLELLRIRKVFSIASLCLTQGTPVKGPGSLRNPLQVCRLQSRVAPHCYPSPAAQHLTQLCYSKVCHRPELPPPPRLATPKSSSPKLPPPPPLCKASKLPPPSPPKAPPPLYEAAGDNSKAPNTGVLASVGFLVSCWSEEESCLCCALVLLSACRFLFAVSKFCVPNCALVFRSRRRCPSVPSVSQVCLLAKLREENAFAPTGFLGVPCCSPSNKEEHFPKRVVKPLLLKPPLAC